MTDRPEAFVLEEVGEHRFRAGSIGDADVRDVVFGGQLLAQMILASALTHPGKEVKSVHAIFARSGSLRQPIEIEVDPMHDGRTLGSDAVTIWQGDRLCARGLILLHIDEPDLIRHQPPMPDAAGPDQSVDTGQGGLLAPGSELRIVDGVNTWDPDAPTGPAELFVWIRLPETGGDLALNQGNLAYATDGFLIGTAMRPHEGIGQNMAHRNISTGVVSHTLTFHEPVPDGEWLLLAHDSPYAGRGRSYGRAHVFTEAGRLVASFVQENLIREIGDTPGRPGAAM
ncbi:MAG TPA: acyl-CoA thioesterase domain-containing protein [Acidimicrobiales bacterium]|nr:acyl-CoA thioesterase domain-containing protein [Acidimicrobiales bacterium]